MRSLPFSGPLFLSVPDPDGVPQRNGPLGDHRFHSVNILCHCLVKLYFHLKPSTPLVTGYLIHRLNHIPIFKNNGPRIITPNVTNL